LPLQAEGEFTLIRQKLELALGLDGQPVKRGTMAHDHIVLMMLADAAAQFRDLAGLHLYGPQLEELARRDDHQPYLAVAHRAWGVACLLEGRHGEAETRLQQALEIFEAMAARWQIGRTLTVRAELDLARSDPAAARAHLAAALAEFEAIGAVPDMERTRAAMDQVV
jgi:tetratricopeptide (TPR) repeat protein